MLGQTFSLYNVAGLIDKLKNIYFVPHKDVIYAKRTTSRTRVCDCYHTLFNEVCPSSTIYRDIPISKWSPEDRTLRVDGTIDNFRVSRGQGLALNYCIVTRTVPQGSGERTYYYAFFIDSVRQAGVKSVELVMSVDHFTNFFYLNNEESLTEDYDPFNPVMRNCFVERQHYDRFERRTVEGRDKLLLINQDKILGSEELFKYRYQYRDKRMFLPINESINLEEYDSIYTRLKNVTNRNGFINLLSSLSASEMDIVANIFIAYLNIQFKENFLLPLTYSLENGSTYIRRGGLTKLNDKSINSVGSPFIHMVFPFISIPYDLSNIDSAWISLIKRVDINNTLSPYDTTEIGNPDFIMSYLKEIGASQYILTAFISKYSKLTPFSVISGNKLNVYFVGQLKNNLDIKYPRTSGLQPAELPIIEDSYVENNTLAYLPIGNYENVGGLYKQAIINTSYYLLTPDSSGYSTSPLFYIDNNRVNKNTSVGVYGYKEDGSFARLTNANFIEISDKLLGFIIGNYDMNQINLYLSEFISYDNMIEEGFYYEPILESDPYKFYSISINQTEQILSKFRYYKSYNNDTYNIKLKPIISYNEAYKIGLIPMYNLTGSYERYYTESVVSIISSQLPLIEDSWLNYYTQNKSQMKSQYAVQRNNFENQLFGGFLADVSQGAGGLGAGYITKGVEGAKASGVKSLGGTLGHIGSSIISNMYAKANIELTQSAKMGDMGAKPDTVKMSGSDMFYDIIQNDLGFHINHYSIDEISYNSNAKYLERTGYLVNIEDSLNCFNRVGLNYIKLSNFDFVEDLIKISQEQADAISNIFLQGITLLHDKDYLHNLGEEGYHNIETSLSSQVVPIIFRTITRSDIDNHLEVVFNPVMVSIEGTGNLPAKLSFSGNTGGYTVRKRSRTNLEVIETLEGINQINLLTNDSINAYTKLGGSSTNVLNVTFADYLNANYYITFELNEGQTPSDSDIYPNELIKNLYAYINEGGDN